MPIFVYRCPDGHVTELYFSRHTRVTRGCGHRSTQGIGCCDLMIQQIITAPIMLKVAENVAYDSPIDGTIINSWQARQEDLKRNNCTPYDPDSRTDYHNRIKESEAALDKTVDAAVEEAIEKMPTAKRGKLYSELVDQGTTADVIRQ